MNCPFCGHDNPPHATQCARCNNSLAASGSTNPFAEQSPYAAPQFVPPAPTDNDPMMRYIAPVDTSPWSIISGYLGLLSLACCILGPFAIGTGVLGITQIKKNPNQAGMSRCIVGIVLGGLGTLGMLIGGFVMLTQK